MHIVLCSYIICIYILTSAGNPITRIRSSLNQTKSSLVIRKFAEKPSNEGFDTVSGFSKVGFRFTGKQAIVADSFDIRDDYHHTIQIKYPHYALLHMIHNVIMYRT